MVLTDIMMPEVTGLQFLEKIRTFNSEIPVIMMTAFAEMDMTIDAIRKGAFDFLLKPFKPEYLAHSVKKAIDHYRLKELEKDYTSTLENNVINRTRELSDALKLVKSASKEIVERLADGRRVQGYGYGEAYQANRLICPKDLPGPEHAGGICRRDRVRKHTSRYGKGRDIRYHSPEAGSSHAGGV